MFILILKCLIFIFIKSTFTSLQISNNLIVLERKMLTNLNGIDIYKENLTKLILSYNKISNIDALAQFKRLKHIDLKNNYLIKYIESLSVLTELEYLDLSYNRIISIRSLQNLSNLATLKLNNNQIHEIDSYEFNWINLQLLDLSSNRLELITELPLNKCFKLASLKLKYNNIHLIRLNQNISSLKYIELSYNQISDLFNFKLPFDLIEFVLSHNQIINFNLNGNFSQLKTFYLDHNQIKDWRSEVKFEKLN